MSHHEITTNGTTLRLIERRQPTPIGQLGPRQRAWLEQRHPGITRNRVQKLRDEEKR